MLMNLFKILHKLSSDQQGGVAVYSVFMTILLLGSTAFVVDYGRGTVVKQQLQNYADASAQAGAAYLDGSLDAMTRATNVVNNTINKQASIADGAPNLRVENLSFYSSLDPRITAATGADAKFLEVVVASEQVSFIFSPFIAMLSGEDTPDNALLNARATASGSPIACKVPPLMMCDYSETMGAAYDVRSPSNYGKQVKLGKASGMNKLASGNFGILDTPSGSQSTQDIAVAMAAVEPEGCYNTDGIDTAPGARVEAVRDGINARFDMPAPPHRFADPAPNIINYPKDHDMASTVLGSGDWGFADYWSAKHPGTPIPADMPDSPSRYQVYLYELDATFAYNGKTTLYPLGENGAPDNFQLVDPESSPGIPVAQGTSTGSGKGKGKGNGKNASGGGIADASDPNYDGVPENNPPVDNPNRRVVEVVLLNCVGDNVRGNGGPYDSNGKYVELFLTQNVDGDHTIYGEVVRRLTPSNSSKLHSNVTLNE